MSAVREVFTLLLQRGLIHLPTSFEHSVDSAITIIVIRFFLLSGRISAAALSVRRSSASPSSPSPAGRTGSPRRASSLVLCPAPASGRSSDTADRVFNHRRIGYVPGRVRLIFRRKGRLT